MEWLANGHHDEGSIIVDVFESQERFICYTWNKEAELMWNGNKTAEEEDVNKIADFSLLSAIMLSVGNILLSWIALGWSKPPQWPVSHIFNHIDFVPAAAVQRVHILLFKPLFMWKPQCVDFMCASSVVKS